MPSTTCTKWWNDEQFNVSIYFVGKRSFSKSGYKYYEFYDIHVHQHCVVHILVETDSVAPTCTCTCTCYVLLLK